MKIFQAKCVIWPNPWPGCCFPGERSSNSWIKSPNQSLDPASTTCHWDYIPTRIIRNNCMSAKSFDARSVLEFYTFLALSREKNFCWSLVRLVLRFEMIFARIPLGLLFCAIWFPEISSRKFWKISALVLHPELGNNPRATPNWIVNSKPHCGINGVGYCGKDLSETILQTWNVCQIKNSENSYPPTPTPKAIKQHNKREKLQNTTTKETQSLTNSQL